jgi:hypothetical protein
LLSGIDDDRASIVELVEEGLLSTIDEVLLSVIGEGLL